MSSKNGEYMIEVDDLHKGFDGNQVLDGVTCQIPTGKISVVMGPSGTGKSVLLRHVVGLLYPDKGDVRVAGKSVPDLNEEELLELRRNVGMLFQDGALFSSMNLYDNVAFPLRQHTKKSEGEIKEIVMERLEEVGLREAVTKMPNELSGGMRKRAALIRTLAYDPPVILMDEPFAAVDAQTRTQLQADLLKLWDIGRKTIIFVTHDIAEAIALGDRALVLSRQPTRIAAEHAIPIPRPRNVQDMLAVDGFAVIYQRIRAAIQ